MAQKEILKECTVCTRVSRAWYLVLFGDKFDDSLSLASNPHLRVPASNAKIAEISATLDSTVITQQ